MYYRILREVLLSKRDPVPYASDFTCEEMEARSPGLGSQRLAAPGLGSRSLGSDLVCFSSPALNSENHWLPFRIEEFSRK